MVSLVPSSTETLLALGADVVACTRFCEQPELLHVGGTKNPDIDAIVELRPDVVVLDREENRLEDHDALLAAGLRVFVSEVRTVDDALAVVGSLAEVAGVPVPVVDRIPSIKVPVRARAFVPIWRRPWMTITTATYGGSMLRRLGVELITPNAETAYPTVELHDVAALRPDLVLVPSEPYDFTAPHLDELVEALPSAEVRRVDGQDLFWWGIRTPGALGRVAASLGGR